MQHLGEITLVNQMMQDNNKFIVRFIELIIDDSEALGEYMCDHWQCKPHFACMVLVLSIITNECKLN